jgi:outer membrane protein OmpA-like peptidoglycan-associated protein
MHDSADAMKHNFLLRGFFKDRGYTNPAEIQQHAIGQLPTGQPVKSFQYDPRKLFDKPDSAKLKNQKTLNDAGQYLQSEKFGLVVIATSTGRTGDSDKERVLSEARGYVVRKYLVENFSLDDTRLKTLGLGKSATASEDGSIEILVYASGPAVAAKAPAKK